VTGVPVSASLSACAICSSVKRLFRIGIRPSSGLDYAEFLTSLPDQEFGRTSMLTEVPSDLSRQLGSVVDSSFRQAPRNGNNNGLH
jgi:hypothetical protein